MRRRYRLLLGLMALFIVLPVLLALALYAVGNSARGRHWIEAAVTRGSAGAVRIAGLSGDLPVRIQLQRLELRDSQGLWLWADDLQLNCSPARLLERTVHAALLQAGRVGIERAPQYAVSGQTHNPLADLHFEIDRLAIARLELGAPLAGAAVGLRIDASGAWFSMQRAALKFVAQRLDALPATYRATAHLTPSEVQAQLDVEEAPDGPLGHLLQWPGIGALSVHLRIAGAREALQTTLAAQLGSLHADAHGSVNARSRAASMAVVLEASAMTPRAGVSWQRLHLTGQWNGPITAPDTTAQLEVEGLAVPGLALKSLAAQLLGQHGAVGLQARAEGVVVPGRYGPLLADGPLRLDAKLRLDEPKTPLEFTVINPVLSASGHWQGGLTDGAGTFSASIEQLKPVAGLAALNLAGRGKLDAQWRLKEQTAHIELTSSWDVSGGSWPLAGLLAGASTLSAAVVVGPEGLEIERSEVVAAAAQASARGTVRQGVLDLNWTLALRNLSALSPRLAGHASGSGTVRGQAPRLALAADLAGQLAVSGGQSGALQVSLRARDLPERTSGELQFGGLLDGAPLQIDATVQRDAAGVFNARIRRGQWRSASAEGEVVSGADGRAPRGHIALHMTHLEDLDRLLGQSLQGSIDARVDLDAHSPGGRALLKLDGQDIALRAQRLQSVQLEGSVDAPLTHPIVALKLAAAGSLDGAPATLAAQFDGSPDALRVSALQAQYQGQTVRLTAPTVVSLDHGISVQRLQLADGSSELRAQGQLAPTPDLQLSLVQLSPQLLHPWWPNLDADGRVDAEARLRGSWTAPIGSLQITAHGLHSRSGVARALPAVELAGRAQLQGSVAQLNLQLSSGERLHLQASGQVPLNAAAGIALKLSGALDLALVNPVIEASGQRLLGQAQLTAEFAGTLAAPQAQGTLQLTHADVQDYPRGLHLADISATLAGDGAQIRLQEFTAHAGSGTVSASGTIGLSAQLPVQLRVQGKAAQTLTSDLITANVDMQLTLTGPLLQGLEAAGNLHINRADIHIPDAFPPDVAVLDVRRPGQKVIAPEVSLWSRTALKVSVDAPRAIFVRGRGIDAEVGGTLQVSGTIGEPLIAGGLDLRNGTVALAGATLTFDSGSSLSFNGTGVQKKINPTLDFSSTRSINGITAKLSLSGYATAPVIKVSSTPEETPDYILALLLFGVPPNQLSTFQIAQIAAALATMTTGIGGGFNPLNAVQRKLGLDRLAISGSTSGGTASGTAGTTGATSVQGGTPSTTPAATLEAGRYVTRRIYLGAKQSTTGSTQAEVQVDLTKHLKVQTVLGTGGGTVQGATPQNDPGSSIGLSYQLEY